jgi:hypothetical protein
MPHNKAMTVLGVFCCSLALQVTAAEPNKYLGKEDGSGVKEVKREPVSIFLNESDINPDVVDFWGQFPEYNKVLEEKRFLERYKQGSSRGRPIDPMSPEEDSAKTLVHGLDRNIASELKEIKYGKSNINLKSDGNLIEYKYSSSGWLEYNSRKINFDEYVPLKLDYLAKFSKSEYKKILVKYANKTMNTLTEVTHSDLGELDIQISDILDKGVEVKDLCLKHKKTSQTVASRLWAAPNGMIIKFILFNANNCIIK